MVLFEFILNIFRASDKTTYSYWIFWFLPTRGTRPFFLSQRVISMLEEINKVFFVFIVVQDLSSIPFMCDISWKKYHVVINETFRHKLFDERSCESLTIDETYLSFFVTKSWTRNVLFRPHFAK